jgi:hypothetical protein
MKRLMLLIASVNSLGAAHAEPPSRLPLTRQGDGLPTVTIAAPPGTDVVRCQREAISLVHCLRTGDAGEDTVVNSIIEQIVQQGWVASGTDKTTRPHTHIFRAANATGPCPPLIMMISGPNLTRDSAPAPAGTVDLMVSQVPDATCFFETRRP